MKGTVLFSKESNLNNSFQYSLYTRHRHWLQNYFPLKHTLLASHSGGSRTPPSIQVTASGSTLTLRPRSHSHHKTLTDESLVFYSNKPTLHASEIIHFINHHLSSDLGQSVFPWQYELQTSSIAPVPQVQSQRQERANLLLTQLRTISVFCACCRH